jgi:transposase-like protein
MVIHGVSTRNIAAITEELCGEEFSQSTVSEWCKRLDPIVHGGERAEPEREA